MSFDLSAYLAKYSDLLKSFPNIHVSLIDSAASPYNLSIASARTCYSSKGLFLPEEMEKSEKSKALRDRIAQSTLEAGHITTRQHAHFVFGLEGVSRNLIWQFLHSHPYYNSEQVSQRYVPIKNKEWYTLPGTMHSEDVINYHAEMIFSYRNLIKLLTPVISENYFNIFRSRKKTPENYAKDIEKRCIEVARYVMPLSTNAYMYHTISALTLYRYTRMMLTFDMPEVTALVLKMLVEVNKVDPLLVSEIPEPLTTENKSYLPKEAARKNRSFDVALKQRSSRLVSYTQNMPEVLNNALDVIVGGTQADNTQTDRVSELLDSEKNKILSDSLYPVTLDFNSTVLNHIHFTFMKKLSHTADSQEQRHRTLPGSRPNLISQVSLENDYITPKIIRENSGLNAVYTGIMDKAFDFIRKQHKQGSAETALPYLLPNAFPIRFYESGDYLNFFHKWKSRLCYNAQEEIFYSSLDEVIQLQEKLPMFKNFIGPPCLLRKNTKPKCPEGDRYCGVKVWKLKLEEYERMI